MVGNKEDDVNGNEGGGGQRGQGQKGDGNGNKGVWQFTPMTMKRVMATVTSVAGNKDDNGKGGKSNGKNNKEGKGKDEGMARVARAMAMATSVAGN